jgi:hypothetical protein
VRFRHAAVALYALLAAVWPARVSFAAEATQTPSARAVELVVVGSSDRLHWLEASLGPQSAPGAALNISRSDQFDPNDVLGAATKPSPSTTLYCWVDLRLASRARIYFSAHAGKRFLLRDVELSGTFDELDRESLSQVLASSWSALFEDEQVGLSREETATLLARWAEPKAAPAPAPSSNASASAKPNVSPDKPSRTPRRLTWFLRIGAFYGLESFSRQLWLTQGPGLSLSGGAQTERRAVGLWLTAQSRFPQTERDARVGVRLESVATRAGVELNFPLDADLEHSARELDARAGVGLDFTHISPQAGSADATVMLTPAHWTSELVLTGSVGATTRLTRNVALGLRLVVDVLPRLAVYQLDTGAGADTLVSPWHVRPGIALELETR